MRSNITRTILALTFPFCCVYAQAQTDSPISIAKSLQIPERTLQPGDYTFSLEDRMEDRAIVKISDSGGNHYLVLAVPGSKWFAAKGSRLRYWPSDPDNVRAVRGWYCESCGNWYELVYPKAEAVAIAKRTRTSVVAVDPESDKITASNLTADDLKVVTLWLLSPYKLPWGGVDLKAAHYTHSAPHQELAENTRNATVPDNLPKTATNDPAIGLIGLLSLIASAALRDRRQAIPRHA